MKDTNEIEKQLKRKADVYIEQKAKEMFEIHKEIAQYLGTSLPSILTTFLTTINTSKLFKLIKTTSLNLAHRQKLNTSMKESYLKTTKKDL